MKTFKNWLFENSENKHNKLDAAYESALRDTADLFGYEGRVKIAEVRRRAGLSRSEFDKILSDAEEENRYVLYKGDNPSEFNDADAQDAYYSKIGMRRDIMYRIRK